MRLSGTIRGIYLFDLAESIDLVELAALLDAREPRREPSFRHAAPEYVRFERAPVRQSLGRRKLPGEFEADVHIRYFDYGVACVQVQRSFAGDWEQLIVAATNWMSSSELEPCAKALLEEALQQTGRALTKRYSNWLSEDYCVVQMDPVMGADGRIRTAEELTRERGDAIAQIVRGELSRLSAAEREEVLRAGMSYYPTDLLVVGWVGAYVYDTAESAASTIELLEYANTQLLEFRYYDEVLTGVLRDVYKRLEKRNTLLGRWRAGQEAESLNTIRLDYQELVERTDNAIKFLSDMFYARMYKLAANRIGATDYLDLVNEKLTTARDLYDSMVNEFHQGRAFFLEITVVVILLIEIVLAISGRRR
ncbi:MAG TPA: hypothetical protein VKX25_21990 [Bryobacteraceae bacterium]|jgi:hypothetical protein|nr:hypothetical protein [Bryobacteraceae bacterium]